MKIYLINAPFTRLLVLAPFFFIINNLQDMKMSVGKPAIINTLVTYTLPFFPATVR